MKKFPEGFYFGASTSSHQVEGWCSNDWSSWEKENNSRLAAESVKYNGLHLWSRIRDKAAHPGNYISGIAADHYNRYEEDLDIAGDIGLNAYRFSVEWSRVEPEEGIWNEDELQHYIAMIDAVLKRGMEPFVTIWHFALPLWLAEKGGIMSRDFTELFARYSSKIAESFSGRVKCQSVTNGSIPLLRTASIISM